MNRRQFLGGLTAAIVLVAMPPTLGATVAAPAPLPAFTVDACRRPDYRYMFQVVVRWEHEGREWCYGDLLDEYNDKIHADILRRAQWAWTRRLRA